MPRMSFPSLPADDESKQVVTVRKGHKELNAYVLERSQDKVYVHYLNTDRRLDEWVNEHQTTVLEEIPPALSIPPYLGPRGRKRNRTPVLTNGDADGVDGGDYREHIHTGDTSEEEDIAERQLLTSRRNFDMVNFGEWQMKTWYFSPYPITEHESEEQSHNATNGKDRTRSPAPNAEPSISAAANTKNRKAAGKLHRTTIRSHGRTAEMLAGGLNRDVGRERGEPNVLWVCDRCFKYMSEGLPYEKHRKICEMNSPPGRKVYQNGAYMIFEVDGAKEKLYCQNLSLFGKLFIDVKTLFFDCENFLFYILTQAISAREIVLGFFSKEKASFDDYNLACIVVFPPYQRKGHGASLIEFSYVLSKHSGVIGTPERPLSDLGLRGYLSYWVATLVRFFRTVLRVSPSELPGHTEELSVESVTAEVEGHRRRRSIRSRGPEGGTEEEIECFKSFRKLRSSFNADGSVTVHVVIECTLGELSQATHIRPEDLTFALSECGIIRPPSENGEMHPVVVSREMVERIAVERGVKPPIIDPKKLLLDTA